MNAAQTATKQDQTEMAEEITTTPQQVAEYLANNSDFFIHHPTLFSEMQLPVIESEGVTDFFAFQAGKLRDEVQQLKKRNRLLIQTSIDNLESQQQIHQLVLDTLGTDSIKQLLKSLRTYLSEQMDVDYAHLCLLEGSPLPEKIKKDCSTISEQELNSIFKKDNETVVLRTLYEDSQKELHGTWSEKAASDGLLKITTPTGHTLGALALVSTRRDRFHPGQGSDLLVFVSQIISHVMDAWTTKQGK